MSLALFDYELPADRIAQEAIEPRDAARLMVVDRSCGGVAHRRVRDLPDLLRPGDLLVLNDARVAPARIRGLKTSGGRVELLLLEPLNRGPGAETWRALVSASRAPRAGAEIDLPGGFRARLMASPDAGGAAAVDISGPGGVADLMARFGEPPLPPYIKRRPGDPRLARDRERYQTVFAVHDGACAAPTAGLHFTPELLVRLAQHGVKRATLTLLVGEGSFRRIRVPDVELFELPPERFELPESTSTAIAGARARGGRVVAVGTTVVRTLESRPRAASGAPEPGAGATNLFIAPGWRFAFVDALLTNLHLPRSSLLMLAAAFAGRERLLAAYAEAIRQEYRFYSYGDAMLIV